MSIQDRVAVLTGATGNLGRLAARRFAEAGARLGVVGTDAGRLQKLADELALPAERLLSCVANLRDPQAAHALAQAVQAHFGRVDILVHLVGGWTGGKTVLEFNVDEVETMLQQHLWTTWHLAQAFVPFLTVNGWGRLVVVSSPMATQPAAKTAPYALAKAAQETLLMTLAQELHGSGVTANVLQVRSIDSRSPQERAQAARNSAWATPEEITAALLYLCSESAGVVNGARIPLY